ncbi:hypothetical protein Y032_0053g2332 [Ancylostoma ceylanicum]|uniref:Peptidase A2 domain-containing protein n=1 Tax=Ancylostoma ceylanicum TaxID=53326 RepID=A0A016U8B2_9BILA|nr:hypothetical protein Y032_0053g2332 [Ancylostoma ceylanicum]
MRLRLLNRINRSSEGDPPTVDDFTNDCVTFVTLRSDHCTMKTKEINAAHQKKTERKKKSYFAREQRHRSRSNVRHRHSSRRSQQSESPPREPRRKPHERNHRCKKVAMSVQDSRTYLEVHINGRRTRLQLDTGAEITMISKKTWNDIGRPPTEACFMPVKTADGSLMEIIGRFETDFTFFSDRHHRPTNGRGYCYVTQSTDLLGLEWCIQMPDYREFKDQYHRRMAATALDKIRDETVTSLKARFAEGFSPGLGRCTKTKAKLVLELDATPVY